MSVASRSRPRSRRVPACIPDRARRTAIPGFIEPCHPSERAHPPSGEEYIQEVKFDGYRVQVHRTPEA